MDHNRTTVDVWCLAIVWAATGIVLLALIVELIKTAL